ncbi:scavenger receptor class B member 1 [Schistocerca americana]|uniref:scavenger receptor class B member 1 n=1 Tax=Schistocerca americana TaxID=7009 RepID=UPI001F50262A|nr:scavenger receptor class B member 1 [Schistocerca americana]
MGLHKQYLQVGRSAKNRLFGIPPSGKRTPANGDTVSPIQMLISEQGKINHGRLAVIVVGVFTLVLGIILSTIPWADYIILKHLRLWNGTISYHYWQKPGVIRLTKVYVFNVTNPDGFLNNGEKPILVEVGPFVYREDMEKVNIKFHDNGTVTYQHNKILQFVPEISADKNLKLTVPNIPLLTLSSHMNSIPRLAARALNIVLRVWKQKPFVHVTAQELMFGYDDPFTKIASKVFPRGQRPNAKMGLLLTRNGTLDEVSTIYTGHTTMKEFGLINRLNGLDHLPYWPEAPCNSISASEGSFFPPRYFTGADVVHVYDKDLCRVLPLRFTHMTAKDGIEAGYYVPPDDVFEAPDKKPDNRCFCPASDGSCPPRGLQNISPCQYSAPVYLSFPHFYKADPSLLEAVVGLKPEKDKHETFFKIQPKLGVPVEGEVRVQLNLRTERSSTSVVSNFPSITFPIIWLEEGVEELTPPIKRWIFLATTVADIAVPILNYGCIVAGLAVLAFMFVRTYKNVVFTKETLERGKKTLRRGSSFIVNGQHRLLILRDSYTLLNNISTDPDPEAES